MWIDGGETARRFLAAGVVHEITVTTCPVILGSGIPFFGPQEHDITLELAEVRTWSVGLAKVRYRVV